MNRPELYRSIQSYVVAVLVTFTLASIFHTQFVLAGLTEIGIEIPLTTRLWTTLEDWVGLLPGYCSLISGALAIAFPVVSMVRKHIRSGPVLSYSIGGFMAMATLLWLMYPILEITLIAGARGPLGFTTQCLAGSIGGICFAQLTNKDVSD